MPSIFLDEAARVCVVSVFEEHCAADVFALIVSVGDGGLVDDVLLQTFSFQRALRFPLSVASFCRMLLRVLLKQFFVMCVKPSLHVRCGTVRDFESVAV